MAKHHYTGTESQLSLLISEEHSTVTSFEVKVSSCQWRALLISQILSFASSCYMQLRARKLESPRTKLEAMGRSLALMKPTGSLKRNAGLPFAPFLQTAKPKQWEIPKMQHCRKSECLRFSVTHEANICMGFLVLKCLLLTWSQQSPKVRGLSVCFMTENTGVNEPQRC